MGKLSVISVGGQMNFPKLSSDLSGKVYAISKVHIWLHMLNDNMKPKKWLRATKKGTKVNFDSIHSQAEYEKGLIELQVFIDEVNTTYGTDFKLRKDGESNA